ncbi:MAG: hypothetical protein KA059_00460, partial [Elusimicrobiales bacterium]|nr:hypothetical protein [Elusimicrobiales bacterium]
ENELYLIRNDNGYFLPGENCIVRSTFSEMMSEVKIKVELGDGSYSLVESMDDNKIYEGSWQIPNGIDYDTKTVIEIQGLDIANNFLLKQEEKSNLISIDDISRDGEGNMGGEGGADRIHYLRIEAAPPEIIFGEHIGEHRCGIHNLKECGSQGSPFLFSGPVNTAFFSYQDAGSGINEITIYKEDGTIYKKVDYIPVEEKYEFNRSFSFPDGSYVQVVKDNYGRSITHYFSIDTTSPKIKIDSVNLTDTNFRILGNVTEDNSGFSTIKVVRHGNDYKILPVVEGSSGTYPIDIELPYSDDEYYLEAEDRDMNFVMMSFRLKSSSGGWGNYVSKLGVTKGIGGPGPCNITLHNGDCHTKIPIYYPNNGSVTFDVPETTGTWVSSATLNKVLMCFFETVVTGSCTVTETEFLGGIGGMIFTEDEIIEGPRDLATGYMMINNQITGELTGATGGPRERFSVNRVYPWDIPSISEDYFNIRNHIPLAWKVEVSSITYEKLKLQMAVIPDYANEEDKSLFRMLKYSDGNFEDITTGYEGNKIVGETTSAPGIYIPVAYKRALDKIGPDVYSDINKDYYKSGNDMYVSSSSIIGLKAEDRANEWYYTSGVKDIYYLLDSVPTTDCIETLQDPNAPAGSCANYIYKSSFSVTDGMHDLYLSAVDKAGNITEPDKYLLCVDKLPPTSKIKINGNELLEGATGYINRGIDIINIVSEDRNNTGCVSGVGKIAYYFDVFPDDCGEYDIYDDEVCIEHIYKDKVDIKVGTHTLYYFAVDNVENIEEFKTANFIVYGDTNAPSVELSVKGNVLGNGTTGYITANDTITINAIDPEIEGYSSGIESIRYLVDATPAECESGGGGSGPGSCENPIYSGPFNLSTGTHFVYYMAVDNAGNESETKINYFIVTIDSVAPNVELSVKGNVLENGTTGYITVNDTITINAIDPEIEGYSSGIESIRYLVDATPAECEGGGGGSGPGSCENPIYSGPFNLSTGTHFVYYMAVDNAGNESETKTNYFIVGEETGIYISNITPSSGPIGVPFTITGESFGNYISGKTNVLFGDTTAYLTLWTDTKIQGQVPSIDYNTGITLS